MASKRARRRKACTGKQRFETVAQAGAAAWRVNQQSPCGRSLTAYRCSFCTGFHFGHTPHRVRQAIAARRQKGV